MTRRGSRARVDHCTGMWLGLVITALAAASAACDSQGPAPGYDVAVRAQLGRRGEGGTRR